jgi:hypothetical protein
MLFVFIPLASLRTDVQPDFRGASTVFFPRQSAPFHSPCDEFKKYCSVFTVLILVKATMRFEDGCRHLRRWHSTPTRQITSKLPTLGFEQRP